MTFVQRFGDALNLNVHFHSLILDGVYELGEGATRFQVLRPPEGKELERILRRIVRQVGKLLERRGTESGVELLAEDQPLLAGLAAASIRSRIATGRRAGQEVLRCGDQVDPEEMGQEPSRADCVAGCGFSLHGGYIQSGNVVLRHPAAADRLAAEIRGAVESAKGFAPQVLALTAGELTRAVADNPFPEAEDDPSKLHLFFLAGAAPQPDLDALGALRTRGERFELIERVAYLHAPEGIGRSKLAAKVERLLGVPTTARNWRTVQRTLAMAADAGG